MTQTQNNSRSWWLKLTKGRALKLFLILLLSAFLFFIGFFLDFHHVLIGYWKGQPRYKGLPADYWKARIQAYRKWPRTNTPAANDDLVRLTYRCVLYYDPLPMGDRRKREVLLYFV